MGFLADVADESFDVAEATTRSMFRAVAITAVPVFELALVAGIVYGIVVLPMRLLR